MKSQTSNSAVVSARCCHRTAAGRQCRQLSADSRSALCAHHHGLQKLKETDDLSADLLARSQNFQTAQGVNFALANIYRLLAANRISARRASVLAYLNSLMLRTFPAIDYDWKNGYKDPTLPKPIATPSPAPQSSPVESIPAQAVAAQRPSSSTNPSPQNSDAISSSAPAAKELVSTDAKSSSAPVWPASVEPDLTKKPS